MDEKQISELAHDALSAACLHIQNALGIEEGDFASMWWCGTEHESHCDTALRAYIKAELKSREPSLKQQVLKLVQGQFEAAWYEFGEVIMIPFNGRKVDLVFGTANEYWGGNVSEAEGPNCGNVIDSLDTSVLSTSDDPVVIAEAILQAVYAWLQKPFLGVFDLGIRSFSPNGDGEYLVYFEDDQVARVEGGAVRQCWSSK